MPLSRTLLLLAAIALTVPRDASAETLHLTASRSLTDEQAEFRVAARAIEEVVIEGAGDRLEITYTSPDQIALDVVPRRRGSGFDPSELLHVTLPAGTHTALIDLTPSPGWSPLMQEYILSSFTKEAAPQAEIKNLRFLAANLPSIARAARGHLAIREAYQVSIPHMLRGTSILGIPLVLLIGILTITAALIVLLRKRRGILAPALLTLTIGTLASTAWTGIDLLRFTAENLRTFYGEGTYSKAGAAPLVAAKIQEEAFRSPIPLSVYVCHDTTDFYTKMLRYLVYPIPVSMKAEDIPRATHVVVAQKRVWAYDGGLLTCGSLAGKARELARFPDGSVLFASVR